MSGAGRANARPQIDAFHLLGPSQPPSGVGGGGSTSNETGGSLVGSGRGRAATSPNDCAGCGHIRSHHPGLAGALWRPCLWRGCGCPWFVQRVDLTTKEPGDV